MKVYDTLIIGSGYCSVGYAVACPNTVICEEQQVCDTSFYLPLRSFHYQHYTPKTEEGRQLLSQFDALSLFREAEQNTNGFEFALCKYVSEKPLDLQLKCRVVRIERRSDHVFDVTVHSNEGLTHLLAKKILDTTNRTSKKYFTVLFVCDNIESVKDQLLSVFGGAQIEPAFYKGRYALHVLANGADENRIKLEIYQKWCGQDLDAKILYMAPVFYGEAGERELCDAQYENPIEAFEAGYFYAKETNG